MCADEQELLSDLQWHNFTSAIVLLDLRQKQKKGCSIRTAVPA